MKEDPKNTHSHGPQKSLRRILLNRNARPLFFRSLAMVVFIYALSGSAGAYDQTPFGGTCTDHAGSEGIFRVCVNANTPGSEDNFNGISVEDILPALGGGSIGVRDEDTGGAGSGYRGCWTDSNDDRALPTYFGNSFDVTECITEARTRGYNYAGLQFYGECWAGNEPRWTRVADEECDTPCNGNPGEMCGGAGRNSIYATGNEPDTQEHWSACLVRYRAKDWAGTIDECSRVVAVWPEHRDARLALGIAYHSIGDHGAALAHYEYILTHINSRDCDVFLLDQQCQREVGRYDRMMNDLCDYVKWCGCHPNYEKITPGIWSLGICQYSSICVDGKPEIF